MALSNSPISQKEYLKKYLSEEDEKKKKKKKLTTTKIKRSKIIDDDIDLKNMRPLDDDEVELYQMDEDAPQIAGIIDERPIEVKTQEQYNSKRWKVFGGEDGVNVVDNMEKNQQTVSDKLSLMSKELDKIEKGNTMNVTKSNKIDVDVNQPKLKKEKVQQIKRSHSSESDFSPPRLNKKEIIPPSKQDLGNQKKHNNSDSDITTPRQKRKNESSSQNNSDLSPPRNDKKISMRQKYDSDHSPPRRYSSQKYDGYCSDSDSTPPRRDFKNKTAIRSDEYPRKVQKKGRRKSDSDNSPPRRDKGKRSKYKSDSDSSPHRKEKTHYYKHKSNSDSDNSPPRFREKYKKTKSNYENKNSYRKDKRMTSSESDSSPPRRDRKRSQSHDRYSKGKVKRKQSPMNATLAAKMLNKSFNAIKSNKTASPRLSRRDLMNEKNVKRRYSDSDDSPPRRRSSNSFCLDGSALEFTLPQKRLSTKKEKPLKKKLYKPNDSSSSEGTGKSRVKKMRTTLDGKHAGLQDAKQLRKELSDLRMKEDVMFSKMDASVSGAGAVAIKRDRKTGQVRDFEKEKEAQKEKEAKASVIIEKYSKWGKGLKQVQDAAVHAEEVMKEMNKPLARYIDDKDLDNFLKAQEREGDPMLDYIKQKQSEATSLAGEKPLYKGSYNPNRFKIRPGHRWDGVVRSNGYEKEWFTHQNARKAVDEEAYKWSTSDM